MKPPPKMPPTLQNMKSSTSTGQNDISVMVIRAISSARYHGLNLKRGTPNGAAGNCAIESALLNLNNRSCFLENLPFSADYYRRIWMTDFKNRTVHDPTWNIYSEQVWEEGWNEMMKSGVYERDIFGDLMIFAIACGVKKIILIFNTSLHSPHDPIYVCDPRKFGVPPDTETPLVLAYNQVHYESMHPLLEDDIEVTRNLVSSYLVGGYQFGNADLPYLLGDEMEPKEEIKRIAKAENISNRTEEESKKRKETDKKSKELKKEKETMQRYKEDIDKRINFLKMRGCALQLIELEAKIEKDSSDISSYKGMAKKKVTQAKTSVVQKPAFTGFCTIDTILNISRVIGFEDEIRNHELCDPKLKCKKCIYRSSICKLKSGKGNRTYIEIPEIRHNLDIFLGPFYCMKCFESFDSEEELENHQKRLLHPIQPQPFKRCLDNLFSSLNLSNWLKLSIACTVCGDELNGNKKAYLIINSEKKHLDAAFQDTIASMIMAHHLKNETCSDGSFRAIYPKGSFQN